MNNYIELNLSCDMFAYPRVMYIFKYVERSRVGKICLKMVS